MPGLGKVVESVNDCCINERSPGLAEASWIGTLGKLVRSGLRETVSQKVKQRGTKTPKSISGLHTHMCVLLGRMCLDWKLPFLRGMSSGSQELWCSFHSGLFKAMDSFFRISLPEAKG